MRNRSNPRFGKCPVTRFNGMIPFAAFAKLPIKRNVAKFSGCFLFAFILVCRSSLGANPSEGHKTLSRQSTVVSIYGYNLPGNPGFRGGGFFVSADGIIATARHVVLLMQAQDPTTVFVKTNDGRRLHVLGVVAEDPEHDLVLLRVSGSGYTVLRFGAFDEVHTGDRMSLICDQFSFGGKTVEGAVGDVQAIADDYQWFAVLPSAPRGTSGCPFVDKMGRIAGMQAAVAVLGGQSTDIAIPIDSVKRLLVSAARGVEEPSPELKLKSRPYLELYADPNLAPAFLDVTLGKYEEAAHLMKLVCDDFPDCPAAYAVLGSYYSRMAQWPEANGAFTKAASLRPDYAFAQASLGMVLAYQGKTEEARSTTERAWKLAAGQKSTDSDTWFNVGGALILLKDYKDAQAVIEALRGLNSPACIRDANRLQGALDNAK